jgi:hypothetical protein
VREVVYIRRRYNTESGEQETWKKTIIKLSNLLPDNLTRDHATRWDAIKSSELMLCRELCSLFFWMGEVYGSFVNVLFIEVNAEFEAHFCAFCSQACNQNNTLGS